MFKGKQKKKRSLRQIGYRSFIIVFLSNRNVCLNVWSATVQCQRAVDGARNLKEEIEISEYVSQAPHSKIYANGIASMQISEPG